MILINKELKMGTLYFVVNENLKKQLRNQEILRDNWQERKEGRYLILVSLKSF